MIKDLILKSLIHEIISLLLIYKCLSGYPKCPQLTDPLLELSCKVFQVIVLPPSLDKECLSGCFLLYSQPLRMCQSFLVYPLLKAFLITGVGVLSLVGHLVLDCCFSSFSFFGLMKLFGFLFFFKVERSGG